MLVANHYSLLSSGTEGARVALGRESLLGKARQRPDLVQKVLDTARRQGLLATYRMVSNRLDALAALGYSSAGIVIAVGENCPDFRPGDRVACAGGDYAYHAEVVFVPHNLAVPVPPEVKLDAAAFATVGAIALQGVRQAELRLGEVAVVIGLGLDLRSKSF